MTDNPKASRLRVSFQPIDEEGWDEAISVSVRMDDCDALAQWV